LLPLVRAQETRQIFFSGGTPMMTSVRTVALSADGRLMLGPSKEDWWTTALLDVDENGFDEVDRKLLLTIIDKFAGGPVGVNALAASISEEPDAIEDIYEPYLLQIGFLDRTPRGRVATRRAYTHFGRAVPEGGPGQKNLF
jgi:hypothetical protein